MSIRVFRAPTSKEALARISRELGPDADIIDRRLLKGEDGNTVVEVTAAPRGTGESGLEAAPGLWRLILKHRVVLVGGLFALITIIVVGAVILGSRGQQIIPSIDAELQSESEKAQPTALTAEPETGKKRIAVLPFENLGPPEDEYFADGISEEITMRLVRLQGLGVISSQSAGQYKKTEKSAREIGEELGVQYLLEGTVRWRKLADGSSRVRITPQLISIGDDTHLWADAYERDLIDIFEVQASIAEQVASALDIELLEGQREALATPPTRNLQAYNYYLRGKALRRRDILETTLREIIRMYEKAVELDPEFALAYAYLSIAHSLMYWTYYDRTEERIVKAKQAVDKAFALSPGLPEAHLAMGRYYYHCRLEYDRALEQFDIAMQGLGRNYEVLYSISAVKRRQGHWEEVSDLGYEALELEPRSARGMHELANTLSISRKYVEAERFYDLAISLNPENLSVYFSKISNILRWNGDTYKAYKILEETHQSTLPIEDQTNISIEMMLYLCTGKYQEALERLSEISLESIENQDFYTPKALISAQVYRLMGRNDLARRDYEEASRYLENRLEKHANDERLHSSLGIAYAGLGMKREAVEEGKLGVALMPVSLDAFRGIFRLGDLAQIYTMTGEQDKAIDQIEYLLSIPSHLSVTLLRIDPRWDPLRDHPRFQKLLREGKQYSR